MSPFQIPEGPYEIDQVMGEIRRQIVEPEGSPPSALADAAPAPRIDDGSTRGRLAASLADLNRQAPLHAPYRVRSHRRWLRVLIDPIKRLLHWGASPYTELVRERQAEFNLTLAQALTLMTRRFEEIEQTQQRLLGRHDLGPFFNSIQPDERLAAIDVTRGTYADIQGRQERYADLFVGAPGQVLDIGCGRGELLMRLRHRGIECWGAEIDPLMIEQASRNGTLVLQLDALAALRSVEDARPLGGLFAAQVIEHLFPGELLELLRLARQKLAPGALVILESVNAGSLGAMAKSFWRDIDHKQPLHPEYLKLLLELAGFEQVELEYHGPFNPEERLAGLPSARELRLSIPARAALERLVNDLNDRLWGMQDYSVYARQPSNRP